MKFMFVASVMGTLGGLWLIVDSFRERPSLSLPKPSVAIPGDLMSRFVRAIAGALVLGVLTRWPVMLIVGGALGWWFREVVGSRLGRQAETDRTEAIAAWTEMLRDTLSGAHGLEETIITSADLAPAPIRREVVTLATTLQHQPIDVALRQFAGDLAHPTGDLVVAALSLAAKGSTRNLAELLGTLAEAARDECAMRLRVEAARARMRTAVRVITVCTLVTAIGLVVFNSAYLAVYGDALGQVTLGVIAVLWGGALWWLARMSRFGAPDRFLAEVREVPS